MDFHSQAYLIIRNFVQHEASNGCAVGQTPPQVCVVFEEKAHSLGGNVKLLHTTMPKSLQNIDMEFWGDVAQQALEQESQALGFLFWCIIGAEHDPNIDLIFGASFDKTGSVRGFTSDIEFTETPKEIDPFEIVPQLDRDYNEPIVEH